MPQYNPDFYELTTDITVLESLPEQAALWFEDEVDRARRQARHDFYDSVRGAVREFIDTGLTGQQRKVVLLYFYHGKTQEDIATILGISQSTVSRHLFGTVRRGKRVGGALRRLQKLAGAPEIQQAIGALHQVYAEAV